LLAVRFLTGLGLGGAMPMLIALASEQAGAARKATMVAVVTAGLPLGGALAGLLARSSLAQDWRMIFVFGGIAPLLAAPLLHLVLPLGRPEAIARQGRAALASLFAPARLPVTVSLWLAVALTALILHLLLNWLPTLLVARGLPKSAAFAAAALFNLGGASGGVVFGLLADRFGPRWPLVGGFLGLALALLGLAAAGAGGQIAALAFAAGFLLMGGQFTLYGLAPRLYADAVRGTGVGAAIAASRLGSIFGPLAAAQLIGGGASGGTVVGALVPVALATGAAAAVLAWVGRINPAH
jgi:AAHS family 3-hydroxyphenylpropionic acid transporter